MPRNQENPKVEERQDREPQAHGQRDLNFEPEADGRNARVHQRTGSGAEDEELAEHDLEALDEDDLKDMEGPDA